MVGSGAPRARRRSARRRRSPGRPAGCGAPSRWSRRSAPPTPSWSGPRRGRPRGNRPRRRAPGGRAGPARPHLDLAAAGRHHGLLPAPSRRPRRPPRLAPAADRGRARRVGRRDHRRAAVAQVAQRPARPGRPQAGRDPRRDDVFPHPPDRRRRRGRAERLDDGGGAARDRDVAEPGDRGDRRPGAGPARVPARGRAALPALDRAPRRPRGLRTGAGLPRLVLDGGRDRRRRPARRLDPRGGRGGGRLGRPPRRRHGPGPDGTGHRRRPTRAELAARRHDARRAAASSCPRALSGQAARRGRGDRPPPASALADDLLARRLVPAHRGRGLLRGRADPGRPAAGAAPAAASSPSP